MGLLRGDLSSGRRGDDGREVSDCEEYPFSLWLPFDDPENETLCPFIFGRESLARSQENPRFSSPGVPAVGVGEPSNSSMLSVLDCCRLRIVKEGLRGVALDTMKRSSEV